MIACAMPEQTISSRLKRFWQDRVLGLIISQLTQGVTPQKIALTIALGLTLAIFPILGATTTLCLIFGIVLKLNQPVIQIINWVASPLQLALIVVFVRVGEWIMRAQRVSFFIPEMLRKFHESPAKFMQQFGMTGVHAIVAWLIIAPFLIAALYFITLPLLKKLTPAPVAHAE
jgi:uncharacterized protein (DUF2062 family)